MMDDKGAFAIRCWTSTCGGRQALIHSWPCNDRKEAESKEGRARPCEQALQASPVTFQQALTPTAGPSPVSASERVSLKAKGTVV